MSKYPIEWDRTFDKDKKYIWISEKKENTCSDCKSLDGKIFWGDKVPLRPHPNCKCEVKEYNENEKFNQNEIQNQKYIDNQIERLNKCYFNCENLKEKIQSLTSEVIQEEVKNIQNSMNTIEQKLNEIDLILNNLTSVNTDLFALQNVSFELDNIEQELFSLNKEYKEIKTIFHEKSIVFKQKGEDFIVEKINYQTADKGGFVLSKKNNQPEAYNFFKIAINNETSNQDYINKNAYFYSNIEKLNDKRKQKEILNRIHSEMPNLNDCQVFLFKQDSSISEKIAKSDAMKNFLIKNMQKIRIFGITNDTTIEFQSNDSDLYATLHGADIKNIRFDKERKNILCTIEDFYNFNPNRTSVKGRIGYKLQEQGDLIPFYVIINVKIPKSVWDNYKI